MRRFCSLEDEVHRDIDAIAKQEAEKQAGPEAVHASVPAAGWKLVPVEPDESMVAAGYDATRKEDGTPQFFKDGFCLGHAAKIYLAMLAAAPATSLQSEEGRGS